MLIKWLWSSERGHLSNGPATELLYILCSFDMYPFAVHTQSFPSLGKSQARCERSIVEIGRGRLYVAHVFTTAVGGCCFQNLNSSRLEE